ncbi:MAG: branched-chain amino acid aminotransferase [Peptoclostridium sp.]|uniref:aminotransferase class IV n=1 Tax=Peptoclostridium sp. TaxID=1904860 RepID=UPI00139CA424|nr:aminotransferase class IV [Peptoclostridium sp.]MZQ76096.1 branched-chain amino acid aminotransferase [Peptoclostridium sp.]
MKNEAIRNYIYLNGKFMSTKEINPLEYMWGDTVYEVVRIRDGVAVYIEDHVERMRNSAKLLGHTFSLDIELVEDVINQLIERNSENNMNIKLVATNFVAGGCDFAAYFINSFYPPIEMYQNGVHTMLYKTMRENPHAKTMVREQRQAINREREKVGAYEALLVDEHGNITEGSRSNLFFIKDGKLYTPPSENVLLGITRKNLLEICREHSIEVIEKEIAAAEIKDFDGAFITGTSISVLPIATIDDIKLGSASDMTIIKLINFMKSKATDYIERKKLEVEKDNRLLQEM